DVLAQGCLTHKRTTYARQHLYCAQRCHPCRKRSPPLCIALLGHQACRRPPLRAATLPIGESHMQASAMPMGVMPVGKLLREHRGVETYGRKGRGSDVESRGTMLPKSKVSIKKEVDSEECPSAAEVDLLIVKKGTQMQ
ncbi:hypothetical protein GW17_00052775, partial [Ensete ventricosum]